MFDVAVVGGGLAGCQAAITLARRNQRVLLLEAGAYPRPKVCGEFLSPEAAALFDETGFLGRLHELHPLTIQQVRITAPNGNQWRSRLPAPALSISRTALDEALAHYAGEMGVELRGMTAVKHIHGNLRNGFSLIADSKAANSRQGRQVFEARAVIAAHGRADTLKRTGRPDRSPTTVSPKPSQISATHASRYLGLKRHFNGPALPGEIDLHVFRGGYCGLSQVEDGSTNVCLLVEQSIFQQALSVEPAHHAGQRGIPQFIEWMCAQNRHLREWFAQATPVYPEWLSIAQVSLATKAPVEGDLFLAGDSAGMIAPLAGDGMAMALYSGKLAALAVDDFLQQRQDADTVKRDYARQWHQTFAARLRLGRWLQLVMLQPCLIAPTLRALNRFPALGDWLVRRTRDLGLLE